MRVLENPKTGLAFEINRFTKVVGNRTRRKSVRMDGTLASNEFPQLGEVALEDLGDGLSVWGSYLWNTLR
jgi:hypothetical protein